MRKNKLLLTAVVSAMMIFGPQLCAEEATEESLPYSLSLTTDFAYYPKSDFITGGTHFSPITGPYDGVELATTLNGSYTISTPLGENMLLKDACVNLCGGLELTPVSIRPKFGVEFVPVPFLILRAGASIGWGWNYLGLEGVAEYNKVSHEYDTLSTFTHPYYDFYAGATFQFDTGALIPGEWSHVLLVASYTMVYTGMAGIDKDTLFEWQCTRTKAQGLAYEAQVVLGYQMPLPLNVVGLMFKSVGYYDGSVYGEFDATFDGDFAEISISPVAQFKLGEKDSLSCIFDFSSRRSFDSEFNSEYEMLTSNVSGREWYFKRLAISWTHRFI
ncbi:MAG: hypothetical protein IKQ43_06555 [Treponema sp.]|nr:hypothetical protein [Treponema sp.]